MSRALGFEIDSSHIQRNIFIPKYYDPDIERELDRLSESFDIVELGSLIDAGFLDVRNGSVVGKMSYGSGRVPFVRTTDLPDWEIQPDYDAGVSSAIYSAFSPARQDVEAGDILFVRDGLLLIGDVAMVTAFDVPLLHQDHVLRMRVMNDSPVSSGALMVALSSPIVRRQVKAKQFSAGIIDKIEDRFRELRLPLPKSLGGRRELGQEAVRIVYRRAELRERLARIPLWIEGLIADPEEIPEEAARSLDETPRSHGFEIDSSRLGTILIPKYHDPAPKARLDLLRDSFDLLPIGDLISDSHLSISYGWEVGKMAYETGDVPFVRSSDLSTWEIKAMTKHRVGREYFDSRPARVDAREGDCLVVRDGTTLVGNSAIVNEYDGDLLYAGGINRLRCESDLINPYLLIGLLNAPISRQQMRAKQFTRDIIDTLGPRLKEVVLPVPRDAGFAREVAATVRATVSERATLRARLRELTASLA